MREREKERKRERYKEEVVCIHLERPIGGGSDSSRYTVNAKESRRVKPVEFLARDRT